jgi:alpha-L-fucosidase
MIKQFGDGRDWFFEKRFGLFIHWGLYALGGWHEQEMQRRNISRQEYSKQISEFNPVNFDPDKWLDLAEAAGMEYLCFTTKHHDGFCLWDTAQTDFNIMNTPYGKDTLAMLADACHRRNFPLCLYYSVVDWHHPNYPNQGRHHETPGPEDNDVDDMKKYMDFLKEQIRELCSNYGKIHGIWWDMNVPEYVDKSVNAMIRELQPQAVINDRGFDTGVRVPGNGDFSTPEREMPDGQEFTSPTEACQSLGVQSWGYKTDEDFFSDKFLMQSIDKILAMGGNFLLNAGPKPDGTIQQEFQDSLRNIGNWFGKVKEAFHGTEPVSKLTKNQDVLLTRKGNNLYVHLCRESQSSTVLLPPLELQVSKAILLNTGQELEAVIDSRTAEWRNKEEHRCLRIRKLPVNKLNNTVPVIKLELTP